MKTKEKAEDSNNLVGLLKCPFCEPPIYFATREDLRLHIWRLHTGHPGETEEEKRRVRAPKNLNVAEKIYARAEDIAPVYTCMYTYVTFLSTSNIKGNGVSMSTSLKRVQGYIFSCPRCGANFFLHIKWVPYETTCPSCGMHTRVSHRPRRILAKNCERRYFQVQSIRILLRERP